MDGFAVLSTDTKNASTKNPAILKFSGEVRPSGNTPLKISHGNAVRLLTGGIVPLGADAVIPFEKVNIHENSIEITSPASEGDFIRKCGADIMKGDVIASDSSRITPCRAALLAYAGICTVPVRRSPSISVLAVGNELCDPARESECGLIPADNLILLKSLCKDLGINNVTISPCANSPESISTAIDNHSRCDLIITTGGTGPGNRDFVFNSVISAGGKPIFKGLAMHPAKSIFACSLDRCTVVGLPGPPGAVNLAFHIIIKPIINILSGIADISPTTIAQLKENVTGSADREKLRPCLISEENGSLCADPLTSGNLSQRQVMNISNGIIVLPAGCGKIESGKKVSIIKCNGI